MWTIQPVKTATLVSPGPEVFFQRDFTRRVDLAIYSFILRSDAATVIVDTGLGDHEALNADVRARKGPWAGFSAISPSPAALDNLSVDDVVLTTFGPYTIGGLDKWPLACVHFSARGWTDLGRPEIPFFKRRLPPDVAARLSGPRGGPVSGRRMIHPGLDLVELGGHSPSAIGVVVTTAEGVVAIADPIFHSENLTRGIPLGWIESLSEWFAMFRKLGPSVRGIIPIHDPSPRVIPKSEWHPELAALADAGEAQA